MHIIRILNITVDIHKSFVNLYYTILQFRGLVGEKSKFGDVSGRVSSRIIISKFRWNNSILFSDVNGKVITYIAWREVCASIWDYVYYFIQNRLDKLKNKRLYYGKNIVAQNKWWIKVLPKRNFIAITLREKKHVFLKLLYFPFLFLLMLFSAMYVYYRWIKKRGYSFRLFWWQWDANTDVFQFAFSFFLSVWLWISPTDNYNEWTTGVLFARV